MIRSKGRKRGDFLDHFRLEDRFFRRYDRKAALPGLIGGFDSAGDTILVKVWNRLSGEQSTDLEDIWHHEVRQLHRLGGYPDQYETIAPLSQAQSDAKGFYLVLKPGQRRPLPHVMEYAAGGHWLLNARPPTNRALLWRNLSRIASGLEILHSQGLIHRNLDRWSILTTGGDIADFQLTGFEWSLRVISSTGNPKKVGRKTNAAPASFLEDWKSFGRLAADLLGINLSRIQDHRLPASEVADHLIIEEVRLLRNLIQAEPLDRLDGDIVVQRIAELQTVLNAEIANLDAKFCLVLRLGTGSSLSESIRQDSDGQIQIEDINEQLAIVRDDLDESALLLAIRIPDTDQFRIALQAKQYVYTLSPYVYPRGQNQQTWEMAYCDRCERANPAAVNLLGQLPLQPTAIEVVTVREAADRYARSRGKLGNWTQLRGKLEAEKTSVTPEKRLHQSLALIQFVETLYAATDVFPVEIRSKRHDIGGDMEFISVAIRQEPERDELSEALGLASPARRFDEAIRDDSRTDEWVLTEGGNLGERSITETIWRFAKDVVKQGAAAVYGFTGPNPAPVLSNPVLIPGDFVGRDIQFRRRLKALRALADHAELQKMLVDPRRRILDSHERVPNSDRLVELDESKKKALEAAVTTLPLFLVQGPPGVGKTRLVRELVTQTFLADDTSRILLTAQSNAAVDHLVDELNETLDEFGILAIRCRAKDSKEEAGPYEIGKISHEVLERLSKSKLIDTAPEGTKRSVQSLVHVRSSSPEMGTNRMQHAKSAFDGLLVRAANLVFATTNSLERERLIEERGQFDWAIVEEAGKATGGELLSPLLLSHRRFLIGDHKQLSPFNSERVIRLLEEPNKVLKALEIGQEFIGRALRDPSTDEVLDELEEEESDLPQLCALSIKSVLLFEHLIETEFALQQRRPDVRKIAFRLTEQHRMHPAIARLISKTFYGGLLQSHTDTKMRFANSACPVKGLYVAGRQVDSPIILVDMPYVQETMGMQSPERMPRWHNPDEVTAVVQLLRLVNMAANVESPPSLAVLSPYREQLKHLKQNIDENLSSYANLASFRPAVGPSEFCGTVDSFQGNEADIVIVSLVRNNHHSNAKSALGFLSDAKRMNVLLSRARWRLVLVGSMKFLRAVVKSNATRTGFADIDFLAALLAVLDEEAANHLVSVISPSELVQGAKRS